MRKLGTYQDLEFYLAVLPSLEADLEVLTGQPSFRLVIFLDHEQTQSSEVLNHFVSRALAAGARAILCGGSAAEKVHDLFDEEIVSQGDSDMGEVVTTTWFTNAPVDEVLWQATVFGGELGRAAFVAVVMLQGDHRIAEAVRIGQNLPGSLDTVVERG